MTAKERVLQFIDYKGYNEKKKGKSLRTFSIEIGVSHVYFGKPGAIGSDILEKIFLIFPELNMDWIITGRGEMLYKKVENTDEWKEKYYKLLDMKITLVTTEQEAAKKTDDVYAIGDRVELNQVAEESTPIEKTKK